MSTEKLRSAKELVLDFEGRGVFHHEDYYRALIRACPQSVRQEVVLFSVAWVWWTNNPKWKPFGKKVRNSA
jgi:hypothetical protein